MSQYQKPDALQVNLSLGIGCQPHGVAKEFASPLDSVECRGGFEKKNLACRAQNECVLPATNFTLIQAVTYERRSGTCADGGRIFLVNRLHHLMNVADAGN